MLAITERRLNFRVVPDLLNKRPGRSIDAQSAIVLVDGLGGELDNGVSVEVHADLVTPGSVARTGRKVLQQWLES